MANKILSARLPRLGFDRNSPLGRFWHWWSGELIALARQSSANIADALLIEFSPQAIVFRRWSQGDLTEQARFDLQSGDPAARSIAFQSLFAKLHKRGERVALWLPETQYLTKQIELPLAAAENLRQVLGFEMDRHTPYKPDQVYFDFRVLQRDNHKNRLTIKLAAAPRHAVDGLIELLAHMGAPAQAVYVASTATPDDGAINLMPMGRHTARPSDLRGVNLGLLLLTLTLAITAIAIPIWQKRQASMALLPIVERAKQQATATDVLRHELDKLTAEYNFMLDKKQEVPPLVVLLDELSSLLPDDTWVQQLNLKGKELQIQGETASSSKLIALFENSRVLHNANFRSPLTKGSTPNSERYQLAAEVKALPVTMLAISAPAQPPAGLPEPGKKPDTAQPNAPLPQPAAAKAATPAPNTPVKPAASALPHPEVKP